MTGPRNPLCQPSTQIMNDSRAAIHNIVYTAFSTGRPADGVQAARAAIIPGVSSVRQWEQHPIGALNSRTPRI